MIAVGLAREGVDVAIAYSPDEPAEDAAQTATLVEQEGRRCVTMRGDLADEDTCQEAVNQAVAELGGIDILVNVTAIQSGFTDLERAGRRPVGGQVPHQPVQLLHGHAAARPQAPASGRGRRRHPSEELVIKNL